MRERQLYDGTSLLIFETGEQVEALLSNGCLVRVRFKEDIVEVIGVDTAKGGSPEVITLEKSYRNLVELKIK